MVRFGQYLKKSKIGFPIVFSKSVLDGGDIFFNQKKILKKLNTSECAKVLVVMWVKLYCVEALLSPGPNNLMKFNFGKLETEVSSSFRRKASERELPGFKHMAVAARRNMLTGAWKLLKRVKCAGALVVPAQASSCREESPDRSLDFKQVFAIYSL